MSFTKNDRKVQSKSGRSFPASAEAGRPPFAEIIASALREEFGGGTSAIKTVARLTRANERAVRNWFDAKNGPSGENLIYLLRYSDVVLGGVLDLADRGELRTAAGFSELRQLLVDLLTAIDDIRASAPRGLP